jgi:delta11-fatty-acid desaturase
MIITKIHNKYYNIEKFNHPGGKDAIWHAYGRDATTMFEMYHPFVNKETLQTILKKYETTDDEAKSYLLPGEDGIPQFEYDTDFSKEVKQEVFDYFKNQATQNKTTIRKITKASSSRWTLITLLNILRILSMYWWLTGSIYGMFAFPLFSWLASVNCFHDACHFSLSDNSKVNKVCSYSGIEYYTPLIWYYQHNISHHAYTNIKDKDVDIYHAKKIIRLSNYTKYSHVYKYQPLLVILQYLLSNVGTEITNSIQIYKHTYFNIIPKYNVYCMEILDKIVFFTHFICRYVILYYWFNNLFSVLIPMFISNALFIINSQITHLHDDMFHNEKDWYKHQVLTSSNHSIPKKNPNLYHLFSYIFSGGLNYQIEHHLFPGVNHCHYPRIQPIIKKTCKKYNITYKSFNGYCDAFRSYYKHICSLSIHVDDSKEKLN